MSRNYLILNLLTIVFTSLTLTVVEAAVLNVFNLFVNPNSSDLSYSIQSFPLIIVIALVMRMLFGIAIAGIQAHLIYSIQKRTYEQILTTLKPRNVANVKSRDTAELARKILLDVANFTNGVLLSATNVLTEFLMIAMYAVYFLNSYNLSLGYINFSMIALSIIAAVAMLQISKKLRILGESRIKLEKKRFFYPNTFVVNYADIHAFKVFNEIYQRASENERLYRGVQTIASIYQNAPRYVIEATILLGIVSLIGSGGNQIQLDPVLLLFIVVRILPSFSRIISNFNSIRYYWSSVRSLREILQRKSYSKEQHNTLISIKELPESFIEIRGVSLPFSSSAGLIDLKFKSGVNYLSGDSGAGKSTLLKVVIRLLDPDSGEIVYSNRNVYDNISYIPQRLELMEATVLENISFFRNEPDDSAIKLLLRVSGLDDVMNAKGISLQTKISEGGANISGGQSQRLSIARGLYGSPKVIILDETLSGIPKSEAHRILDELEKDQSRIVIVTSHDPTIFDGRNINRVEI